MNYDVWMSNLLREMQPFIKDAHFAHVKVAAAAVETDAPGYCLGAGARQMRRGSASGPVLLRLVSNRAAPQ